MERDSSTLVLVHLFNKLVSFFIGHVESSALNHSLELFPANLSVTINIKRVEGIIDVEIWHAAEPLANGFCLIFSSEVGSPTVSEFFCSDIIETIITSINWVLVVRWTSVY